MEMPVIDLQKLDAASLRKLAATFDAIVKGPGLSRLPHMAHDPVRKQIDDSISHVCGLGDLAPLRAALAAEPIITNKPAGISAD